MAFILPEIAKLVDVPYSTLYRLLRQWAIRPSIKPAANSGSEGLYSARDVLTISVCSYLYRRGFGTETILKAVRFLQRANLERRFAAGERYLIATPKQLFIARGDAVFSTRKPGSVALVCLDLPVIQQAITKLKTPIQEEIAAAS
ncbi:MAG: hypothetical protein JSS27_07180 [Planctomycetes bacterium]|nr:hypothetical protein [Planctomycetota bacterium]